MPAITWIKTSVYESNGTPITQSLDGEIGTQVKDKLTGLIWIKSGSGLADWTLFSSVLSGLVNFPISDTVITTNATQTVLSTIAIPVDTVLTVDIIVNAKKDTDPLADSASYKIFAVFENSGGTTTQIGSTQILGMSEDNVSWDVTMDVSGSNARLLVTGVAATNITWKSSGRKLETTY